MYKVSVDVGSGFTQFVNKGKEGSFPTIICPAPKDLVFGMEDAPILEVKGQKFLYGEYAKTLCPPESRADTLSTDWAGSTGWIVALYSALYELFKEEKENNFEVNFITGLPQKLYSLKKDNLEKILLSEEHKFKVYFQNQKKPIEYSFKFNNIAIIPQVIGAMFFVAENNPELFEENVGIIDVGTYTTGFSVVEQGRIVAYKSDGCLCGVSQVCDVIQESIFNLHAFNIDKAKIHKVLLTKQIVLKGQKIDLTEEIRKGVLTVAKPLMASLQNKWGNASDMYVYIAGGGAELFFDPIKSIIPHAVVAKDYFFAVVKGMYNYLKITEQK